MALKMEDFPQTPDEKRIYSAAYDRGKEWIMLFAALAVPAPLGLIWWQMREILGPEGAVLIVIVVQIVAIVTIPDRVMAFQAHLALRRYRASQPKFSKSNDDSFSTAPVHPWGRARRYDLRTGFTLWIDDTQVKAWADSTGAATPWAAEPSDIQKYFEVLSVVLEDHRYLGWATAMINQLQLLLAKVILNHRRECEFFREHDLIVIADRLHLYCQEQAHREAKK